MVDVSFSDSTLLFRNDLESDLNTKRSINLSHQCLWFCVISGFTWSYTVTLFNIYCDTELQRLSPDSPLDHLKTKQLAPLDISHLI